MADDEFTQLADFKYFTVELLPRGRAPKRKTRIFQIRSKSQGVELGIIKWESGWRQYVFHPNTLTIWSDGCLQDVKEFLALLRTDRKSLENADSDCAFEAGTRVYHRRRDMLGTIMAIADDEARVKYEWPMNPEAEAESVLLCELVLASSVL